MCVTFNKKRKKLKIPTSKPTCIVVRRKAWVVYQKLLLKKYFLSSQNVVTPNEKVKYGNGLFTLKPFETVYVLSVLRVFTYILLPTITVFFFPEYPT